MKILFYISLFLILYTYVIYPFLLFLFVKIFTKKRKKEFGNEYFPKISMIISAYNEEDVISDKISNCLELNYPEDKLEILLGSDGSIDNTNKIIKYKKNDRIKIFLYDVRVGKTGVLNKLVPESTGEILIFSDASSIYEHNALKEIIKPFKDKNIGGVCGRLLFKNNNANPGGEGEKLYWSYETAIKKLESKINSFVGASGAIYAIRKKLFRKLPEEAIIDDFLISMSILIKGYKLIFREEAVAYETTAGSMKDEFKRRVRIGSGNFQSIKYLRPLLFNKNIKRVITFWSHKLLRWTVPIALLILLITNIFLFGLNTFFSIALIMQGILYLSFFLGWFLDKKNIKMGILYIPYYFVFMNLGLLVGFWKFIRNKQSVKWD